MTKPFEFLVFSDFHAHNFTYGATRTTIPGLSGLYNSRLADSAAVLDEILSCAKHYHIEHVFFCGDLFHRRTSVPTDVRHVVVDRLHKFADEDIQLHMIPGNHDMGDRHGYVHSLVGLGELSDFIHVYDSVSYTVIDDIQFVFVPYTEGKEAAKSAFEAAGKLADLHYGPSYLMAHAGIQGATVGSDYVLINDSDISVSDVPHRKFTGCFFGHFHEHQQLFANGWYVGATHQHNWGDRGGNRGYLHVKHDRHKATFEFEKYQTMAPEFITTRIGANTIMKKNDFVKAFVGPIILDRDELKEKWGLDHLELVYEIEEADTEFTLDTTQLSPAAVLDEWVDKRLPEGLEKAEVLSTGKDILKEVGLK